LNLNLDDPEEVTFSIQPVSILGFSQNLSNCSTIPFEKKQMKKLKRE